MNLDQRYRCSTHSDITVGATHGVDAAPSCPVCRQPMTLVLPPDVTQMPPTRRQQHTDDPRAQRPPRPEGRPL